MDFTVQRACEKLVRNILKHIRKLSKRHDQKYVWKVTKMNIKHMKR